MMIENRAYDGLELRETYDNLARSKGFEERKLKNMYRKTERKIEDYVREVVKTKNDVR